MQSVCRECSEVEVLQNFNEIVIPKGMKRRNQTTPGIGKSIKSRLNVVFITMLESESAMSSFFRAIAKIFHFRAFIRTLSILQDYIAINWEPLLNRTADNTSTDERSF